MTYLVIPFSSLFLIKYSVLNQLWSLMSNHKKTNLMLNDLKKFSVD